MKLKHTPSPWKALRNYEYYDETGEGTYYDPEPEEVNSEYVRIGSKSGNIISNHDLFKFKNPHDAKLIELAPEMAESLESVLYNLEVLKDESLAIYELKKILEKLTNV